MQSQDNINIRKKKWQTQLVINMISTVFIDFVIRFW